MYKIYFDTFVTLVLLLVLSLVSATTFAISIIMLKETFCVNFENLENQIVGITITYFNAQKKHAGPMNEF